MERKLNTCPWHPWPGISSVMETRGKLVSIIEMDGWKLGMAWALGKHIASVGQATWSGKLHLRARLDH